MMSREDCKKQQKFVICVILHLGLAEFNNVRETRNMDTDPRLLTDVIGGIEKVTEFLESDYHKVNVDGLLGVRMCQGSLIGIINDCGQQEFQCPEYFTDKVKEIYDRLEDLTGKAIPHIQQDDPKYFASLVGLLDTPYIVEYIPEQLDQAEEAGFNSSYNAAFGNDCFSGLLGNYVEDMRSYPRCSVTDVCWNYMTTNRTAEYFTTHNVLYYIIGVKTGCKDIIEKRVWDEFGTTIRDMERSLCAKIFSEAVLEENNGKVPIYSEDLFLEQTLLCGILGFENFFSEKWMRMVLSWQTESGCFGFSLTSEEFEKTSDQLIVEQQALEKELQQIGNSIDDTRRRLLVAQLEQVQIRLYITLFLKQLLDRYNQTDNGIRTGRKLLTEKLMDGNCLSHKTGLAIGSLGVYLRFLMRKLFSGTA